MDTYLAIIEYLRGEDRVASFPRLGAGDKYGDCEAELDH